MPTSVQYTLSTGTITGTVSGVVTSTMPDGIGQIVVDDDYVDPASQMVDITQNPPVLVAIPTGS